MINCTQVGGIKLEYYKGVEEFITACVRTKQFTREGTIRCPCHKCKCRRFLDTPTQVWGSYHPVHSLYHLHHLCSHLQCLHILYTTPPHIRRGRWHFGYWRWSVFIVFRIFSIFRIILWYFYFISSNIDCFYFN